METLTSLALMKHWSRSHQREGKTIGFVPTMGYLHEGHLSLMRRGRSENDLLVASIFVNPTQFGQNEDLDNYPRDPEADLAKCAQVGVDAMFMPAAGDIYGPDFQTFVEVENVARPLCGASRPGHFRGVATVVLKLFNVVSPTAAYFGQKDYQQLRVIKTMVRDLDLDVTVVPCPTVREDDGLAMSSRNSYLSPRERQQATCLYQALQTAQSLLDRGEQNAKEVRQGNVGSDTEGTGRADRLRQLGSSGDSSGFGARGRRRIGSARGPDRQDASYRQHVATGPDA